MTDHLWAQEQIAAFLTDGLDVAERIRFEAHVRDCAECFTSLEAARAFDSGLANLFANARPSPTLEDRTLKSLERVTIVPVRKARSWGRHALIGLAATLFIGAFGALTSLIVANGGLPMPGESFAWGNRTNSPTMQFEADAAPRDFDGSPIVSAHELAERLQNSIRNRMNANDESREIAPQSSITENRALDSTWERTYSEPASPEHRIVRDEPGAPRSKLNVDRKSGESVLEEKPTNRFQYSMESGRPTDGRIPLNNSDLASNSLALVTKPMSAGAVPGGGGPAAGGVPTPSGVPGNGPGGGPRGDYRRAGERPAMDAPSSPPSIPTPSSSALADGSKPVIDGIPYFNPSKAEAFDAAKMDEKAKSDGGNPKGDNKFDLPPIGLKERASTTSTNGIAKDSNTGTSKQLEFEQLFQKNSAVNQPSPAAAPAIQQPVARKIIIRSGDIEFEVESFDSAVATVTLLVTKIPNGYVGTVNSEKLPNGKVKGSVVVRVPPESLDALVLELRKELGKTGELKGQRIGSQDITKMYTDLESRLKAARAMETRLLAIIKDGKGEIKQLLEAEKELGVWRTKIEEYEGELRYYGNLASLSTLTITMAEKEIRTATGITENERVQAGIEVEDVDKAFRDAMSTVLEAKGRVTKSELKQLSAGQYSAVLNFEVAPDTSGPIRDRLKQLGRVARLEIDRQQTADGGPPTKDAKVKRGDTVFLVQLYNLANVAPRESAVVQVAVPDVAAGFRAIREVVEKLKGRVIAANLSEGERTNVTAQFDFEVKRADEASILAAINAAGDLLSKTVSRAPESDAVTDTKVLFRTSLISATKIPARETTVLQLAVHDIPATFATLQTAAEKAGGRILTARLHDGDGQEMTQLDFELKRGTEAPVLALIAAAGDTVYRNVLRAAENVQASDTKIMYQLTLLDTAKLQPRETTTMQYAVLDIPAGFRAIKESVEKAKGRIVNSTLNENDKLNVTAQLDFEMQRGEEGPILAALESGGDILGRQTTRQQESRYVSSAKSLYRITFVNANRLKPRETTTIAVEVSDVEATMAVLSSLATEAKGRLVDSNIANDRAGRVTAKLVFDVPFASAAGIAEKVKNAGIVRVQQSSRDPSATDGKYATTRLDLVISNTDLIVPKDDGIWPQIRKGLAYSASALLSSLSWVIFGLCVVLPWVVIGYFGYRLVRRTVIQRPQPVNSSAPSN